MVLVEPAAVRSPVNALGFGGQLLAIGFINPLSNSTKPREAEGDIPATDMIRMTDPKPIAPNDYLAAERTFLAWIRTGLALIGLGFIVARFGLFLQTLSIHLADSTYRAYGLSLWFGTGLIILGVIVIVGSLWNFFHLIERLKQGNYGFDRPPRLATAVTIALAAAGLAMAIYLISVH